MKRQQTAKEAYSTMNTVQTKLQQSTSYKVGKLQQQIGDAKKVVEELLERKLQTTDKNELEKINKEKKERIKLLKRLAKKLRETYKETKKERELKSAGNILDGIEYHNAKRSKNPEGMPKVRKIRAAREEARNKYLGYLSMEEEYYRLDPPEVPGSLFLHQKIIEKYGLLPDEYLRGSFFEKEPYEEANDEANDEPNDKLKDESNDEANDEPNDELKDESNDEPNDELKDESNEDKRDERTEWVKERRMEWLESKDDNGQLYWELKEEIFDKRELNEKEAERTELEGRIDGMIREGLSSHQLEMYERSKEFMDVWSSTKIKTKKMKERYKLLLHALATLKSETCLPIVEFFQMMYKSTIITNDYDMNLSLKNKNLYVIDQVGTMLEEYKQLRETIQLKKQYIWNNNKYLKNELYMYLTGEKVFKEPITNAQNVGIRQTGKYFVRWIKLTVDQQGERFESYARWYVEKFLIGKNLVSAERRLEMVEKLATLLHESYKVKHMIYRDFAWKTKSGMIETVKILQYDNDSGEFKLKFSKKPKVIDPVKAAEKAKRKAEKKEGKSILNTDNTQRINDVMLRYIIETKCHLQTEAEEFKVYKNKWLHLVKKELGVKSVSALDRQKLFVEFTDMCHAISNGLKDFVQNSNGNVADV